MDADRGAAARSSRRTRASARQGARVLEGRTIVVTRAAAQAQRFTQLLEAAGARVIEAPAIVIGPPPSWEPLDTALAALTTFAWVVFTSVNGVSMVDRYGRRAFNVAAYLPGDASLARPLVPGRMVAPQVAKTAGKTVAKPPAPVAALPTPAPKPVAKAPAKPR